MTTHLMVHATHGGSKDEFGATLNWFANPAAKVSTHYVADGKTRRIARVVPIGNVAWHAGLAPPFQGIFWNNRAIGYEICRPFTDTPYIDSDYDLLAMTITTEIVPVFGAVLPIGHDEVHPGNPDPGPMFDWRRLRSMLA